MDDTNILNSCVDKLYEIKNELTTLSELHNRSFSLEYTEEQLEGDIAALKRQCSIETENTIKEKKGKIISLYSEEQETIRKKIKALQKEKTEEKKEKILQKIYYRTSEYKEKILEKKNAIREISIENNVPKILRSSFCNSIFKPEYFWDLVVIMITLLLVLALPFLFITIFLPKMLPISEKKPLVIIFICWTIYTFLYSVFHWIIEPRGHHYRIKIKNIRYITRRLFNFTVLVELGMLVFSSSEELHKSDLIMLTYTIWLWGMWAIYKGVKKTWFKEKLVCIQQIENERKQIKVLRKLIKKEKQHVISEKDNIEFGAKDYDNKIFELEELKRKSIEEENVKMTVFENETKLAIVKEIQKIYNPIVEEKELKIKKVLEEKSKVESEYNQLYTKITTQYESYLGKENIELTVIESLIKTIESGRAHTIADALKVIQKTSV